jgi:hypothetical protein
LLFQDILAVSALNWNSNLVEFWVAWIVSPFTLCLLLPLLLMHYLGLDFVFIPPLLPFVLF